MRTSSVLLASLAAATAAGVRIDPSLPDGIYSAHHDVSNPGQHIFQRHGDTHARTCAGLTCWDVGGNSLHPKYRVLKEKLPIPKGKTFCRRGRNYTTEDYHAAINALFETPLFWIPPRSARFALHGGTVAYICTLLGWNTGSLVEFMEAMVHLDGECGENMAGKLTLTDWEKFYGRETRGNDICQWEFEHGGVENEVLKKAEDGCDEYVNGIQRWLGSSGKCNDNATGKKMWQSIKKAFPWYKTPADADALVV